MSETLLQIYDVTYRDAEGEVIAQESFLRFPDGSPETQEREVHFLEVADELKAADYEVRFMRSNEIRKMKRQMQREDVVDRVTRQMAHITGLDRMIELLPAMAEMQQPNVADAHFART
jgi:hypothetical protein